jgi:predicted ATPase
VPDGLYLLDEPETALSPQRQLAFLAMLKDLVTNGAQFIIATHSPIILAFPDAVLLRFDGEQIKKVAYDEVENVQLTRDFLNNPELFLRYL